MNPAFWIVLLILAPSLIFITWLVLLAASVRVEPGTLGIALLRGRSTGRVMEPGRHFVRPWRRVMVQAYPSRELALVAGGIQQSNPDVDYLEQPASVLLGDGSSATVDYTVRCQLIPDNLQRVHDTYGPEGIWSVLRDVSRQSVIVECAASGMSINDMFGDGYRELANRISDSLAITLGEVGFELKLFSLRKVDLGPAADVVQAKIRAGAELDREHALAVVRRARVENDAALLADADSLNRDQLLRYRQIEAWNDLLEHWDGRQAVPSLLSVQTAAMVSDVLESGDANSGLRNDEQPGDGQ